MLDIQIFPFTFVKPGVPLIKTDDEKFNFPKQYTSKQLDLKDYPEGNEILGVEIHFDGLISNNDNYVISAKFFDDETGSLIWSGNFTVEKPQTRGFDFWDWYTVNFWIGHVQWEIFKETRVRIEVKVSGTKNKAAVVYQQVTDSRDIPPEEPGEVLIKKMISIEFRDLTKFSLINLISPSIGYLGSGIQGLLASQGEIQEAVNINLPKGWVLTNMQITGGRFFNLEIEERGSDPFTITAALVIIAIIAAVLIILGLLVVAWKITDNKTKKTEYETVKTKADLARDLIELGVDPDMAIRIIEGVDTPDPPTETGSFLDDFKVIIIVAVIGVIAIMLIGQIGKKG